MVGVILAGGQNRRISFIKGFIEINGKKLINSQIELLRGLFERIIISTNTPELYFYLKVPLIGDIVKQKGPMTGIFSTFICTGEDKVFVIASDMPFIKPQLIRHIIKTRQTDAVVPIFNKRPEPLLGVYSKKIIAVMERRINEGNTSLTDMLGEINTYYIKEDEVRKIDPIGRSFININTEEDLKRQTKECKGSPCISPFKGGGLWGSPDSHIHKKEV